MYDVAIVGAGAAGLSAALTLKLLNRSFIWLGGSQMSAKVRKAEKIKNYPGLTNVSGEELSNAFLKQMEESGISVTKKTVTGVYQMDKSYTILCDKEEFSSRAVIVTTGVEAVKQIKGEAEFLGRGVSYCATCDGFLYKSKTIAVVCTDKSLEEEVKYLATLANKVYFFPIYKGAEVEGENISVCAGLPTAIEGDMRAKKIVGAFGEIDIDGAFFLKTAIAPSALIGGIETDGSHIKVDRMCRTNLAGCFAAGDCTGRPYQYAKAVGEGNVAAYSANEYLSVNFPRSAK